MLSILRPRAAFQFSMNQILDFRTLQTYRRTTLNCYPTTMITITSRWTMNPWTLIVDPWWHWDSYIPLAYLAWPCERASRSGNCALCCLYLQRLALVPQKTTHRRALMIFKIMVPDSEYGCIVSSTSNISQHDVAISLGLHSTSLFLPRSKSLRRLWG